MLHKASLTQRHTDMLQKHLGKACLGRMAWYFCGAGCLHNQPSVGKVEQLYTLCCQVESNYGREHRDTSLETCPN